MTLPKKDRAGRCAFHAWVAEPETPGWEQCLQCGRRRRAKAEKAALDVKLKLGGDPALKRGSSLKRGRGFAASPKQQEKVRFAACAYCGQMRDEYRTIDPAHITPRGGHGGCSEPDCVIPLCRTFDGGCHRAFDAGELDIVAQLEPTYRKEIAHAIGHMGLVGTLRRLEGRQSIERKVA